MKLQIKNWTESSTLNITATEALPTMGVPVLVSLTSYGGSLSFHHALTPEQARFMAAALQMAAEQAEAMITSDLEAAQ